MPFVVVVISAYFLLLGGLTVIDNTAKSSVPISTPTPSVIPTPTPMGLQETPTVTVTLTPTISPSPTPTDTPMPTATIVPTVRPTSVPTVKPFVFPTSRPTSAPVVTPPVQTGYQCNCKKTCPQMSSCTEAYYQLRECHCSIRDGDSDGVPCEAICSGG